MRVYILTEGGRKIGLGHVVRCSSLCRAFEERGIMPEFIINGDDGIREYLKGRRCRIENWLDGRTAIFDEVKGADAVFVDSYLADLSFYREIAVRAELGVYLDDDMRLDYPRGVVLNGAIGAKDMPYPRKQGVKHLLGEEYLLLRQEFLGTVDMEISPSIGRVMITFGGDDIRDLTPRVMGLVKRELPDASMSVVIGKASRNAAKIETYADERTRSFLFPSAEGMKEVMLSSDIAVSAGGQTLYELARVGLPTVAVCVIGNQEANIRGMGKKGFIEYAGEWDAPDLDERIISAVRALKPREVRKERSVTGRRLVDGKGAARVVEKILESAG